MPTSHFQTLFGFLCSHLSCFRWFFVVNYFWKHAPTKLSISLCWHFCVDFRFSKTLTVINSMTRTFLIKKLYKYELVNALFISHKCKIMVFWARTNTKIYHRSSSIFITSNHGARFQLSNFASMWILYNHRLV